MSEVGAAIETIDNEIVKELLREDDDTGGTVGSENVDEGKETSAPQLASLQPEAAAALSPSPRHLRPAIFALPPPPCRRYSLGHCLDDTCGATTNHDLSSANNVFSSLFLTLARGATLEHEKGYNFSTLP